MTVAIDYSVAAELYASESNIKARNSRYMRFPSVAEAVRFAMEEMPSTSLRGIAIETGDERYEGEAIRTLYNAPGYPLKRGTP